MLSPRSSSSWQSGDWASVSGQILRLVAILAVFYVLSLLAGFVYNQLMAVITQGSLAKLREKMFSGMQNLPIRYFDTHNHGDVMSYYTNDIDTLRQMISQSFPQLIISIVTVVTVLFIMLYYSLWLTLVVVAGRGFHDLRGEEGRRALRPVFYPTAAGARPHRGLYRRNDERPEGGQGLLP